MPHPERAAEAILGSDDGMGIVRSLVDSAARAAGTPARRRGGQPMTIADPPVEPLHRRLGVTDEELEAIRDRLGGREPNDLELAMFSVMWSEHCSYKSSKPLLKTLPTDGPGRGRRAGRERRRDLDRRRPARSPSRSSRTTTPPRSSRTRAPPPVSAASSATSSPWARGRSRCSTALRFGDPADPRTRHLVDGVVRGVGGYGNCVGVPTVGGELVFDPSYAGNPLVNVMAIGLLREDRLTRASAPGPGNLVVLYGSATGRDGIGGASVLASATFTNEDPSKRPSVQVGDPFAEKLLIEASLELIERGLVEGLQDLGAGGITCATSETADRAGTGIIVDLDAIPRREPGLEPFEVMISESQERMCAAIRPDRWPAVLEVCQRWGLPAAIIGRVTGDGDITVVEGGLDAEGQPAAGSREIARVPARRAHQRRDRACPGREPARPPAWGPGSGCTGRRQRPAPRTWHGSRRRAAGPGRIGQPVVAPGRLPAIRLNGRGGHRRRPGSRGGRAPGQGHAQGPRRHDRREPIGRDDRPVARRGALGRRGDPERVDHRSPAARRDQLPQLRRSDPARRVLAAQRGRSRVGRRVPRARPAGHRRQRLALQRVTDRADRADPRDRRRRSARRHLDARRAGLRRRRRRDRSHRRCDLGPRRVGLRGARRRDGRRHAARPRSRARGSRPGVHPRGDRPRPGRVGPGRVGRGTGGRPGRVRDVERPRRDRSAGARRLARGRVVRREPVAAGRDRPAGARRGARPAGAPARSAGRADRLRGWRPRW